MSFQNLINIIDKLDIPKSDYAIFGSGPLIVRGLIEFSNDLDIICRGKAWEMIKKIGKVEYLSEYDVTVVSLEDGAITFGTEWGIGNPDINQLIDEAELINGIPFVTLSQVAKYKLIRRSKKDLLHIEALRKAGFSEILK